MRTLVPFTNINLVALCVGYALGTHSHTWAVASAQMIGSTLAFMTLPILDTTAYARQRSRHGYTIRVFYTGHLVLHILPCLTILANLPTQISLMHAIIANCTQMLWAIASTGTLYVDSVYIPLAKGVWQCLWVVTLFGHYSLLVYCMSMGA